MTRWLAAATALAGGIAAIAISGCAGHRPGERPLADLSAGAMREVSGGTFQIAERTGPAHDQVTYERVRAFLLDTTEVTVAAYAECVKAGRCAPAPTRATGQWAFSSPSAAWSARCNGDRADRADHPVNCVDWGQAVAYCAWAGKRLPTEAEWEWAARGAGRGTFPWGGEAPADRACWSGAGSAKPEGTCAAGSHPGDVSRAGVRDLAGDVWEWTSSQTYVAADSRGRGGTSARVARGGSWHDDEPQDLSSWQRREELPSRRDPRLGFRCASDR